MHVEGGVRYCLDPTRVMFSSGNVGERMHFHTNVDASGQVVVDMFAGIGYFTLPLACSMLGRPACIHALELNPVSAAYLVRGAAANHVAGIVSVRQGDNREGYLERCADRVLMGYIPTPRSFVPRALQLLRWPQGGVVHYHYTATEEEANTLPLCHFEQPVFRVRMLARRTVKSYAPRVWHYVADLECVPIVVVAMEQEGLTGVGALAAAVGSMSLAEAAQVRPTPWRPALFFSKPASSTAVGRATGTVHCGLFGCREGGRSVEAAPRPAHGPRPRCAPRRRQGPARGGEVVRHGQPGTR